MSAKLQVNYYPYGLKIAALSSKAFDAPANPYQYQGDYAEFDDETGWNEFELRNYDAQIGRFTGIDPYDQFASGYVGMGNDPVNLTDPSGGISINFGTLGALTGSVLADMALITLGGAALGCGIDRLTGGNGWTGAAIGGGVALGATFIPPFDIGAIGGALKDAAPSLATQGAMFASYASNISYSIYQRSFAPWATFGRMGNTEFHGDNRDYSLDPNASSRIWGTAQIDISNGTLVNSTRGAGATISYDLNGNKTGEALASTSFDIAGPRMSGNETRLMTYLSGSNPLVKPSQPIVWNASIAIVNNVANGYIDVGFGVYGKGFPAYEAFIADAAGNKAFLNVFQAPNKKFAIPRLLGSPLTAGSRTAMRFYTDSRGIFTGKMMYRGKTFSLTQWNSWIQSMKAAVDK